MEDILSSIRRIIADDQKAAGAAEEKAAADTTVAGAGPDISIEADIAALRSALDAIRGEVAPLRNDDDEPVEEMETNGEEPAGQADQALLSRGPEDVVRKSFSELETAVSLSKGRNLDDMARDMLRPMLKSWLDENLPALVERLVREEIKRLVNSHD